MLKVHLTFYGGRDFTFYFKAEIRHPMRKQGNLTPLIHLKMHLKKLNTFNNCLMA